MSHTRGLETLWEPLGGWRVGLVWRLFGVCLLDFSLIAYASDLSGMIARGEWQIHGLTLCGLLLMAFGPRLLSIAITAAWLFVCFGLVLSDHSTVFFFPAAEWSIWLALPLMSLALILVLLTQRALDTRVGSNERYRDALDRSLLGVFRIMVVVALGCAALHKINADFFDTAVSCISLKRRLVEWWHLPHAFIAGVTPGGIVVVESLVPILLLTVPLVGIALSIVVVFAFMSIGAPAFAGAVIAMSMAFLPDGARAPIALGLRARWPLVVTSMILVVGGGGLLFTGDYPWLSIALSQAVAIAMLWCVGFAAKGLGVRPHSLPAHDSRPSRTARACLAVFAILLLTNGLTPYLGLKFQYSFAMLSNLRVDDDRWNSWVFPRWIRLTEHDPFIHVQRVRYKVLATGQTFEKGGILDPALYSPSVVRYRLARSFERGIQVTFDFDYQSKSYRFVDEGDPRQFYSLISSLPATPHFQKVLDRGVPQSCEH